MRKLFHRLKVAAAAVAMTTLAVASAHAFEASGYMTRDPVTKASSFFITNLESGRPFRFIGTGASCKPNGQRYDDIGKMMGFGSFHAKVIHCPYDPSLAILFINNYRFYTTVSYPQAFDDFDGNF